MGRVAKNELQDSHSLFYQALRYEIKINKLKSKIRSIRLRVDETATACGSRVVFTTTAAGRMNGWRGGRGGVGRLGLT